MVSKYPMNTASKKQAPRGAPDSPGVPKPANDNRIGAVLANLPIPALRLARNFDPFMKNLLLEYPWLAEPVFKPWDEPVAPPIARLWPAEWWQGPTYCPAAPGRAPTGGRGKGVCGGNILGVGNGASPPNPMTGNIWMYSSITPPGPGNRDEYYYTRKSSAPALPLASVAPRASGPRPHAVPLVAPLEFPIGVPMFEPSPQPLPRTNPQAEPKAEPSPRRKPAYDPGPKAPGIFTFPWPGVNPWIEGPNGVAFLPSPRTAIVTARGRSVKVTSRKNDAKEKPPRKGTKQKKPNIRDIAGASWVVINGVTEGIDAAMALHDSLPEDLQAHKKAPVRVKLKALWNHWDKVDLDKFWPAFINMQIEDFFYGVLGHGTKKLTQVTGMATGVDRAINQQQQAFTTALNKVNAERAKQGLEALDTSLVSSELPGHFGIGPVDIDWSTGVVSLR